jgi:hypothetical protein
MGYRRFHWAGKWSLWQQCRGNACREGAAGGVCKSSQPYAAEIVQIPVSHRGSQTSASSLLTATNTTTSAQRHRGFRPNDSGLHCRRIPIADLKSIVPSWTWEFVHSIRIGPGYCATRESMVSTVTPSTVYVGVCSDADGKLGYDFQNPLG